MWKKQITGFLQNPLHTPLPQSTYFCKHGRLEPRAPLKVAQGCRVLLDLHGYRWCSWWQSLTVPHSWVLVCRLTWIETKQIHFIHREPRHAFHALACKPFAFSIRGGKSRYAKTRATALFKQKINNKSKQNIESHHGGILCHLKQKGFGKVDKVLMGAIALLLK